MTVYERKTGPGWAYILCDICGTKIRQKDAILITDKYNTHYGLLVCKQDVDKTNQQDVPFSVRETQVQNPRLLRSEPPDKNAVNPYNNRVPGAPQQLQAVTNPLGNGILLQWLGPQDNGSGPIIGYQILFAQPQATAPIITLDNTGSSATSYIDTAHDISGIYTYYVKAINTFGIGAISEPAYFPSNQIDPEVGVVWRYLLTSQDSKAIRTGYGAFIKVRI